MLPGEGSSSTGWDQAYACQLGAQFFEAALFPGPGLVVSLAGRFHDAGTYDPKTRTGGPTGCIRSEMMYTQACNAGLKIGIDLLGEGHSRGYRAPETRSRRCHFPKLSRARPDLLSRSSDEAEPGF